MPAVSLRARLSRFAALAACAGVATIAVAAGKSSRMLADEGDGHDWASFGRTYRAGHYSPLHDINRNSAGRLGLVWALDLPGVHNGATVPLAVDGVIYFTVDQSLVHAVDVQTGRLLWRFDPMVAAAGGRSLRYGWGSRGLAYWKHRLYVGTTDGRLIALSAGTGKPLWSRRTVQDDDGRYITGAPRVFEGKVIIGHGGADYSPVRGYVTAYDAASGRQLWRFHTVPGNPADGFESDAMRMAASTWSGEWWKHGGGGTVWNAITYDPELRRIYIGTGNGAPWNAHIRSPGGGDNLFLCSIVALDAQTGAYVWHYQTTPGETWDFNSAMDITLATLRIDDRDRRVILHAPKNGFFYVIDRDRRKLISAEKFARVTWAERIDPVTARPIEYPESRYRDNPVLVWPGPAGAHNWQPMSFSPQTGLVYVPTLELPGYYSDAGIDRKRWRFGPDASNTGLIDLTGDAPANAGTSSLLAWDPIAQRPAWRVNTPGVWNGGTLATAGELVFQGQSDGRFNAYDARNGEVLWSFNAGNGISGAPITFKSGNRQFVAVVAGWGGIGATYLGTLGAQHGWVAREHPHRLLVFALGGAAQLPDTPPPRRVMPIDNPAIVVDPARAESGAIAYSRRCAQCHGVGGVAPGYAPDLRASPAVLDAATFEAIVRGGAMRSQGMPGFAEASDAELEALRHFVRQRARESLETVTEPSR